MTASAPVSIGEARNRARDRLRRELRTWAVAPDDARLELALHPPTERAVLADQAAAITWARAWVGVAGTEWATRQWPRVGAQRIPVRLTLVGANRIADFAGGQVAEDYRALTSRAARVMRSLGQLSAQFPDQDPDRIAAATRARGRDLLALPEFEVGRTLDVLAWLVDHPAAGFRARQLPIRGVDTKWLEQHRPLVEHFYRALTGQDSLGLVDTPELVRVRFLDQALRPSGIGDLAAPIGELARLRTDASRVLVVENLETLLALPDLAGVIAVHGKGSGVGARISGLAWARQAQLVYWGDLDSHGFAILDQLRRAVPHARSVLMDDGTLLRHRDLWVPEPVPTPSDYPNLTAEEMSTLSLLRREGNVRLEQERIDWEWAIDQLTSALGGGPPACPTTSQ